MKVDRSEQDQARRDRIARVAFELFAQRGLDAISAQDIAQAAYVSRTNLYRYFPSKVHMLLAHFEKAVAASRDDALERLRAGASPQLVWDQVTLRMADLGVRYRHLVGAVGQAVLVAPPTLNLTPGAGSDGAAPPAATASQSSAPGLRSLLPGDPLRTALTLAALVEPVLLAMQTQGRLRPEANVSMLSVLFVDACLLALLHGGHRDQREVLRDWQERFSLLMYGVMAPQSAARSTDDPAPAG
ncbi:TetR/AcrR family transcriptional regulator [Deinococcus koreensis]|uniref:TetR family transcriptional regulator n=1 Tax=Deinococcus koreensis TaxID=2054903 RepID=A0A2K3V0H8_9DEIO|nr:TetR/AcrR family transcriptional regulator [Deinococcus koreensis]PNY82287.1 TetR family transcriptional regulator [Deinococcus koreensis]